MSAYTSKCRQAFWEEILPNHVCKWSNPCLTYIQTILSLTTEIQSGTCQLTTKSPYYLSRRKKFNLICKFTKDTSILQGCRGRGECHFPDVCECPRQLAGFCSPGWTLGKAELSSSTVKQQSSRAAKHEAAKSHSKVWERWGRHNSGLSQRGVSWVALSQPEGWPRAASPADRTASAHSCPVPDSKKPSKGQAMHRANFQLWWLWFPMLRRSKYLEQVLVVTALLALKKTYVKPLKVPSLDQVMLPNCGAGKEEAFFSS